jgi:uncharacterized protein YneF (UPF0154 family)
MMVILIILISAILAGLYLGLPYVSARKRRKDLERRGRIKPSAANHPT